ncbi:MAG: hypothetical protein GX444_12120 [Myxococcales bacterium]|nr:hypothetical protein [Myxococcales bacterium]
MSSIAEKITGKSADELNKRPLAELLDLTEIRRTLKKEQLPKNGDAVKTLDTDSPEHEHTVESPK